LNPITIPGAAPTPLYTAIIVAGAGILATTKIKPVWVIAAAAVIGLSAR
jgi:hypothetical protein